MKKNIAMIAIAVATACFATTAAAELKGFEHAEHLKPVSFTEVAEVGTAFEIFTVNPVQAMDTAVLDVQAEDFASEYAPLPFDD